MTKRRNADRTPALSDTLPEREAVERAIEAVLDRLRPTQPATARAAQAGPARKCAPGRKDR